MSVLGDTNSKLLFIQRQCKEWNKNEKEKENASIRENISKSLINYQSQKQKMFNDVLDNRIMHELEKENQYEDIGIDSFGLLDDKPFISSFLLKSKNVVESVPLTNKELYNKKTNNLILQIVQTNRVEETEVKETYCSDSDLCDFDKEKYDIEKDSLEKETFIDDMNTKILVSFSQDDKEKSVMSSYGDTCPVTGIECKNHQIFFKSTSNPEEYVNGGAVDHKEIEREKKQFSPLPKDDTHSDNVREDLQSKNLADREMIRIDSLRKSPFQVLHESTFENEEGIEMDIGKQVNTGSQDQQCSVVRTVDFISEASQSVTEFVLKGDDSMAEKADISTSPVTFENNRDKELAKLSRLMLDFNKPLNEDAPDSPLDMSLSLYNFYKQHQEVEMTAFTCCVDSESKLFSNIIFDFYQSVECLESDDMNDNVDGLPCMDGNPWQNKPFKDLNANREEYDLNKYDCFLKKTPLSMDNRWKEMEMIKDKSKTMMPKKRNFQSRRKTNTRQRKNKKSEKFYISRNIRNKHDNPLSNYVHATQPSDCYSGFLDKCIMKQAPESFPERQKRNPDKKSALPGRTYIDLLTCQWRCHKFMDGQSKNSDGSNGGANNRDSSERERGRDEGADSGHENGENYRGNNGNNNDGDKGDKRKNFPMEPNIVKEEDEELSGDENIGDANDDDINMFNIPRPPDKNGVVDSNIVESNIDHGQACRNHFETEHSSLTVDQLCYLLGLVCRRPLQNVFDGQGYALNRCFSRIMHQLQQASLDSDYVTECQTCQVLEGLFRHLGNSDHSDIQCDSCRQIYILIIHHTELCISQTPPQTTDTDLCYKICQSSSWDVRSLKNNTDLFRMIMEYCSVILKMLPDGENDVQHNEIMEHPGDSCILSLTEIEPSNNAVPSAYESMPVQGNFLNMNTSQGPFNSVSTSEENRSTRAHTTRHKSINQRHPIDIPPPIKEEASPGSDDEDVKNLTLETIQNDQSANQSSSLMRFNKSQAEKATQSVMTLNHTASLPEGNVHDATQFHSYADQPTGIRGIGEVVFDDRYRLRLVAMHWGEKSEECERTNMQPSQLREEGVILNQYRDRFRILGTRYQEDNQWRRLTTLGYGMHGRCFLATDMETGHRFCVKKIELLHYKANELCLWVDLDNRYIVKLYGAIRHGYIVYIFSEFIEGGDLSYVINQQKSIGQRLSHWTAINYFQQLLKALAYLRSHDILHEDIKAENILLRGNSPHLVLTDFGISRRQQGAVEMKNKWPAGTPTHFSPEKAACMGYGFPADVWAAVCVLVYMISGRLPWHKYLKGAGCLNYIIYMQPPPMDDLPSNIQDVVRDLIARGFVKDPENRPSAEELLHHEAFQILNGETPDSFYSTLMTGLNSVGAGSIKMSEKKPHTTQAVQKIKDDNSSVSSDSSAVLYSISIPQEVSAPHLPTVSDEMSHQGMDVLEGEMEAPSISGNLPVVNENPTANLQQIESHPLNVEDDRNENVVSTPEQDSVIIQSPYPDLTLLPRLQELLPSMALDSNIRGYLSDKYDPLQRFDNPVQNSILEVYDPHPPVSDEIPNLSIFDGGFDTRSSGSEHAPIPDFGAIHSGSSSDQNSLRDLDDSQPDIQSSPIEYSGNLSSGSPREYKDANNQLSYAPNIRFGTTEMVTKNPSNVAASRSQEDSGKGSAANNYQNITRKKPINLTLDVKGSDVRQFSPYLFDETKDTAASNAAAGSASNNATFMSLYIGTHGIFEAQEKELKDIMSSQSSENGTFADIFGNNADSESEDEPNAFQDAVSDMEITRPTDERPVGGRKISFFNENNEELFHMRFLEIPASLYHNISEIKREIFKHGYKHFELRDMNGERVSLSSDNDHEQLKIIRLSHQQDQCVCDGCRM